MQARSLDKDDYDFIVRVIDHWWEGPTSALAHPMFFYELGSLARVVTTDSGERVGFLFGFVTASFGSATAASPPVGSRVGYVHLVGIDPDHRRKGVARLLYSVFESDCRAAGCVGLKAITTAGNDGSVRFHQALGWTVTEVEGYAGPGRTRFVFEKSL
jgi:GNAT superfamily N-acetyltransferase